MAAEEINRQLRNRLGYTMQDLEANRAGRLSNRQLADTRWHLMTQAAMYSGAVIVVTIMTLNYGENMLIRLGLGAGALIFVVGYFYLQWAVDVRSQRVATVAGPVSKEQYESHGTNTYTLIVRGERVGVSASGFRAFTEGETYRLYYTPQGHRLLSAEYAEEMDYA